MQYLLFINLSLLCNPQFGDIVILNCLDYGLLRVYTPQCLIAGHCHDVMGMTTPCTWLPLCTVKIECSCNSFTQVSHLYSRFFPCWEMENDLTWVRNSQWITDLGQGKAKRNVFCRYKDNEVLCMLCVVWLTSLVLKKHLLCILKQDYFEAVPCNKGQCTVHKLQASWRKQTSDIFHSSP